MFRRPRARKITLRSTKGMEAREERNPFFPTAEKEWRNNPV
jgi:hypothetical protein